VKTLLNENRFFGPPGTGKTTRLATVAIPAAVEKYGADNIVVTSFTRAAAREIAGRGIAVEEHGVGTLHSLCYRGLGFPELTAKHMKEWNQLHPHWSIVGTKVSSLDEGGNIDLERSDSTGDKLMTMLSIERSKMTNPNKWYPRLKEFSDQWKYFKYDNNLMDFTDLIEKAIEEKMAPPQDSKIMFVDEAQDMTPLQFKLIRMWGESMDRYILVGDDDQTIYSFTGASPEAFLGLPIPEKNKKVLGQSYRVPRAILERSLRLIQQVKIREKKTYKPRIDKDGNVVEGRVRTLPETFKHPAIIERDIEAMLEQGKTCMVLTSCAYMLTAVRNALLRKKIPFGNEYRPTRGDWNPLASGGRKRVNPRDLVYTFLSTGIDGDFWNVPHFLMWVKHISVNENGIIYKQGNKVLSKLQKMVEANEKGLHSCREVIKMVLTEKAAERALARDLEWFQDAVKPTKQKKIEYPIQIYNKYKDIKVLEKKPPVTIGTIHSVKGGQADVVYLYPDISLAAEKERQNFGAPVEDALKRLFYVGMTRAKEELVIMDSEFKRRRFLNNEPVYRVEF
jgi:DNA helicase-2/ATP-dependent DNA helicase PcrA